MFPPGVYVAVLQPYLKHPRDNPEMPPMLRCDHPNGVRIFGGRDEWMRSMRECSGSAESPGTASASASASPPTPSALTKLIEEHRQCGIAAYKGNRLEEAIDAFTRAIDLLSSPAAALVLPTSCSLHPQAANAACNACSTLNHTQNELRVILFSNRAQCHLSLEHSHAALLDAEAALKHNPSHAKSLLRRAKALLQLQRTADSLRAVEQALALGPPSRNSTNTRNNSSHSNSNSPRVALPLRPRLGHARTSPVVINRRL